VSYKVILYIYMKLSKILVFIGIFILICIVVAFKVKEGLKNRFKCRDYTKSGCIMQPKQCHWNRKKKQCRNRCDKYNEKNCNKHKKRCYWNEEKEKCREKHKK